MKSVFIGLLACCAISCTAKTYSDNERQRGDKQSTYDVWDFEIVSAYELAGKKYRVAVINDRRFNETDAEVEGLDGLDDVTRKNVPVGVTKRIELDRLQFHSINERQSIEVRGLKNSNLIVNITHVKSCPVTTDEHEQTSIVGDSSKGMITVPKLKTVIVRTYSAPACAEASDRAPSVSPASPSAPSAETLAAVRKSAEENAENARQLRLNDLNRKFENEFKKKVAAVSYTPMTPSSQTDDSFCPRLSSVMIAAGVTEILLERKLIRSEQHEGYTSQSYESRATLLPMNETFVDGDFSRASTLIRSVKTDARGCVTVTLTSKENGYSYEDFRKISKELEQTVQRYQRNKDYARAQAELAK